MPRTGRLCYCDSVQAVDMVRTLVRHAKDTDLDIVRASMSCTEYGDASALLDITSLHGAATATVELTAARR